MTLDPVAWLVFVPLVAMPLTYFVGRITRPAAQWVAVATLVATGLVWVVVQVSLDPTGSARWTYGAAAFRADGLSMLVAALAIGLGLMVVLFSGPDLSGKPGEEKYYALILAEIGSVLGLASAADLFNLWVWFEVMAVASYVLVAFYREVPESLEAALKYLIQSAAGSALALLGIALFFAQTGSLSLEASGARGPLLLAAGALMLVGFGVKTAFVPFHAWLPDVYAQAPSGVSSLLSGVVTKLGLVAVLKALAPMAGLTLSWGVLLMAFGALNMLVGNLIAYRQTGVKRLLAYSSLSHLGYIFVGVGIGVYAGEAAGTQGGVFHLLTHGLMSGVAFLAAGALLYALRWSERERGELTVADLAGVARRYPAVALVLSIAVLGLGGLPPFAGFMSKWQILVAGFETGNLAIAALVVFAALNSVFSLAYYTPLVNAAYRQHPSPLVMRGEVLPVQMTVPLLVLGALVVAIGIWPTLAQGLTQPAGAALLGAFAR